LDPAVSGHLLWPHRGPGDSEDHAGSSATGHAADVCPDGLLTRTLTIDLFDEPQHIKFRKEIVRLRSIKVKQSLVAEQLGLTVTVVQHAMSLTRKMGLDDPYQLLREPPADACKLKRYLHPRYRFRPLEGFPRFELM